MLFQHCLQPFSKQHSKSLLAIQSQAIERVMNHSWPGNVRELENLIERVMVTTDRGVLPTKDFCRFLTLPQEVPDLFAVGKAALQKAERARILQALRAAGGNKQRAAPLQINWSGHLV
ncbi:MAG: helix-turn-helix domain-containing protein [Nitrospirota bacterium]|nr:helix-turn-helix domain-containing protein [Nitrospirota bacterium]